jgi:hypothetical protein
VDEKKKRSKLPEKAVRVPSIQLERKAQVIRDYLSYLTQRPDLSEYARGVAFVQLLKDLLLDAAPQFLADYLQGMEHSLAGPKTTLYIQGRIDALYGNLVVELKRSLSRSLEDAKRQLTKYLGILLSQDRVVYLKARPPAGKCRPATNEQSLADKRSKTCPTSLHAACSLKGRSIMAAACWCMTPCRDEAWRPARPNSTNRFTSTTTWQRTRASAAC